MNPEAGLEYAHICVAIVQEPSASSKQLKATSRAPYTYWFINIEI